MYVHAENIGNLVPGDAMQPAIPQRIGVCSLSCMHPFVHLFFTLQFNQLKGLIDLSGLTRLVYFNGSHNKISSIALPTSLTLLNLARNSLTNTAFLAT